MRETGMHGAARAGGKVLDAHTRRSSRYARSSPHDNPPGMFSRTSTIRIGGWPPPRVVRSSRAHIRVRVVISVVLRCLEFYLGQSSWHGWWLLWRVWMVMVLMWWTQPECAGVRWVVGKLVMVVWVVGLRGRQRRGLWYHRCIEIVGWGGGRGGSGVRRRRGRRAWHGAMRLGTWVRG